jgi:hypothetical protein
LIVIVQKSGAGTEILCIARSSCYLLFFGFTADSTFDERMSAMRKRAEQVLESRSVFFFLNKDDLKTSAKRYAPSCGRVLIFALNNACRLEEVLRQLYPAYYKDEIRRLKKERERLNKITQTTLLCRLTFKIAFYHEAMQNFEGALK